MGVEDHELGTQLVRFRWWPRCAPTGLWLAVLFVTLSVGAARDEASIASFALAAIALLLVLRAFLDCAAGMGAVARALEHQS
jgi:hypothetical protein